MLLTAPYYSLVKARSVRLSLLVGARLIPFRRAASLLSLYSHRVDGISTVVLGFFFLLIFDRDKLQSEDYQIKKQTLNLVQAKGGEIEVLPTSINGITNPEQQTLSSTEDRGGG